MVEKHRVLRCWLGVLGREAWENFQEADVSPKAVALVRWREGTERRQALRKEREKAAIKNTKKFFSDYREQQMAKCKGQTD